MANPWLVQKSNKKAQRFRSDRFFRNLQVFDNSIACTFLSQLLFSDVNAVSSLSLHSHRLMNTFRHGLNQSWTPFRSAKHWWPEIQFLLKGINMHRPCTGRSRTLSLSEGHNIILLFSLPNLDISCTGNSCYEFSGCIRAQWEPWHWADITCQSTDVPPIPRHDYQWMYSYKEIKEIGGVDKDR